MIISLGIDVKVGKTERSSESGYGVEVLWNWGDPR